MQAPGDSPQLSSPIIAPLLLAAERRRFGARQGPLAASVTPALRAALRKGSASMRVMLSFLFALLTSSSAVAAEVTIGLIPEQNVFAQMKRYEPIGSYVEGRTGVKIRFTLLPRYGNIIDSFTNGKLDGAFWGSFTGALAIQKLGIQPVARPLWLDGTSTYHGYLFVRKDSGIQGVPDMKGKSIAFVERATTAGYVFPMAYFKEHGVTDLGEFFKEHYFAGSHDAAISAVLRGEADVGCAKNTIFNLVASRDPTVKRDLLILAESPKVPSNGLGLRPELDPRLRKKIAGALLDMHEVPAGREVLARFGAIRFIPTTKDDYASVFDLTKRAGIDLKEYDYVNE